MCHAGSLLTQTEYVLHIKETSVMLHDPLRSAYSTVGKGTAAGGHVFDRLAQSRGKEMKIWYELMLSRAIPIPSVRASCRYIVANADLCLLNHS